MKNTNRTRFLLGTLGIFLNLMNCANSQDLTVQVSGEPSTGAIVENQVFLAPNSGGELLLNIRVKEGDPFMLDSPKVLIGSHLYQNEQVQRDQGDPTQLHLKIPLSDMVPGAATVVVMDGTRTSEPVEVHFVVANLKFASPVALGFTKPDSSEMRSGLIDIKDIDGDQIFDELLFETRILSVKLSKYGKEFKINKDDDSSRVNSLFFAQYYDFNGDGNLDLIVSKVQRSAGDPDPDFIDVFLGPLVPESELADGNVFSSKQRLYSSPVDNHRFDFAQIVDLDQDGKLDLVIREPVQATSPTFQLLFLKNISY